MSSFADVAQLVEHQLPKLRVAGSNPVIRSNLSRIMAPVHAAGVFCCPEEFGVSGVMCELLSMLLRSCSHGNSFIFSP